MIEATVVGLTPMVGVAAACRATGRPRASHYRHHRSSPPPPRPVPGPPRPQPRALAAAERQALLDVLHSERFVDQAPAEGYATLLDEGSYLASIATMYRVLRAAGEVAERRRQATHPPTVKPELVAAAPNRVWSWDITKLLGPAKWTYYYLYVVLDIFSRYVPGWMVAERESAALAERLLDQTITKQHITRDQLAIHADRGPSMASKQVAQLLADLGVTKSHSRPHISNDNPTARASSRPSSTAPPSPTDSVRSRTPAPSASSSSAGTTPPTIIRASGCWSPPMSTTAAPSRSERPGPRCSPPPTPRIPSGSSASHPSHQLYQPSPGSTSPTHRRPPSNFLTLVPHPG